MFVYKLKTELLVCQIRVNYYILRLNVKVLTPKKYSITKTTQKVGQNLSKCVESTLFSFKF